MFRLNSVATRLNISKKSFPSRTLSCAPSLKEGDRVPSVVFKVRVRDDKIGGPNPFKWKDVSTNDLFGKKRVVLFALPGGNMQSIY